MENKKYLSIIIPVYNEAESFKILFPTLIQLCKEKNWQLIVVNDGSTDGSKELIESYFNPEFVNIIHHKLNKGYGAAIKSGISECDTEYLITFDADGQHRVEDIELLYTSLIKNDADMVVGSRKGFKSASIFRGFGKSIIRNIAKILMHVPIYDINSGMKIYNTALAKKYICLAPDTMSFSDIIALIFINNRHLVIEVPIVVNKRNKGKSTIGIDTAFHTIMEIINIVILFNPMKIILPLSLVCFFIGLLVGLPILLRGHGVSTGALLGIIAGIIFFLLGLIAEQLSAIRKNK